MATPAGPLGKYSQAVAAVMATVLILSAVAVRIIGAIQGTAIAVPFIDNAAWVALGAVFGAAATTSVNGGAIEAAHRRLDQLAAPPSDYLERQSNETERNR